MRPQAWEGNAREGEAFLLSILLMNLPVAWGAMALQGLPPEPLKLGAEHPQGKQRFHLPFGHPGWGKPGGDVVLGSDPTHRRLFNPA